VHFETKSKILNNAKCLKFLYNNVVPTVNATSGVTKSKILNNAKCLKFLYNNVVPTVNATSGVADGFVAW